MSILTLQEKQFLEQVYLNHPYIVSSEIQNKLESVVSDLQTKYPQEFYFLTLVGGQANGSFVLRTLQKKRFGSDVDLYLGGRGATKATLVAISQDVRRSMKSIGLGLDGLLNGKQQNRYLDLSEISNHIERGDFDLLALPFQCSFGRTKDAQLEILKHVVGHKDETLIWSEMCTYHQQSLSLHNGQWSESLNREILHRYQKKKLEKFSLSASPSTLP